MMKQLDSLPEYGGRYTVSQNEQMILDKHKNAVKNFKKALSDAMIWKNQIHYVINKELRNRN